MTHRSVRIFLCFLVGLAMLFAFIKLGIENDWYSIAIAISACATFIVTWVITKDEKKEDEKEGGE